MSSIAPSAGPRKVCIFARLWEPGLGDLVQREIFFSLLRRAWPEAELTLVLGPAAARRYQEFLSQHSCAQQILVCPEYRDEDPGRWQAFRERVTAEAFDGCLVDPDSRGLGVAQAADYGIGIRIGFLTGHPDDDRFTGAIRLPAGIFGLPDLVDLATSLATHLGVEVPDPVVPPFRFTPQEVALLPGPVVVVHPGGARHWNRRWPLVRYGDLCRALHDSDRASFVLAGSGDEQDDLHELAGMLAADVPVQVSAGETLDQVASRLVGADVLVGNDSSLAHIAAALDLPTVVLYGPGMTEFMWTRAYRRHDGINLRYDCQTVRNLPRGPGTQTMPCRYRCHYPYESAEGPYPRCLTDIGVDVVHRAVVRRLARRADPAAAPGRTG